MNSLAKIVSVLKNRRWLILPLDCTLVALAFYLAWVLRFDSLAPQGWPDFPGWQVYFYFLGLQVGSAALTFIVMGIYRNLWVYASLYDIYQILKATLLSALLGVSILWLYNRMENFPRSALVIEYILLFLFLSFRSFSWRLMREIRLFRWKSKGKLTLLIGAGRAGNHLVRELRVDKLGYNPVVFLDQNQQRVNSYIQGIPVWGGLEKLPEALHHYRIEQVILTEKLKGSQTRFIYRNCEDKGISCKTLPPLTELLANSPANMNTGQMLRELQLEDLLGREPIKLETENIRDVIEGQTIFITGAGGSIGSELCYQLLHYRPMALVLLDIAENAVYEIDHALRCQSNFTPLPRIASLIGDVRDESLLDKIFRENDIQTIFHCAAYKHVPLMELNPERAILNNVIGTIKLAQAARNGGVERFVMLSTDKAVNPVNIMGATKRIAELYIHNVGRASDTHFMSVRFGNVLGSKGSVIPLFSKQIKAGGPITVTHPEITRYFMTIPEAVGLVIQASIMGKGGDIFILDMGEPIKIKELAEDMIRFTGLRPHRDIAIQYIGLRPGEKLFEELLLKEEGKQPTHHKKIQIAMGRNLSLETLNQQIHELIEILSQNDRDQLDSAIARIIPEYRPVHHPRLKRESILY